MNRYFVFLIFLFVSVSWQYGNTTEQFIDPKIYQQKQSVVTETNRTKELSPEKEQKIIEFIEKKEERNEQVRQNNQKTQSSFEEEIVFIQQDIKFSPINAIVLDAGHGGKDPGGVSNGITEKKLVLALVKKVHALFRKYNNSIKIYVTRKDDQFVSLEERVSKTVRWSSRKNVLFVSIHGNIAYNKNVSGFEIYTLSDKASDTDALATERIENAGFSQEDIEKTSGTYSILADLIRDGTRIQSEWLAKYVYEDSLKFSGAYGRGLKRANFFVLKYNTVPSILIEVGYMSNSGEAKQLKDEEYQKKISIGIYEGISRFIKEYNQTEGFTK